MVGIRRREREEGELALWEHPCSLNTRGCRSRRRHFYGQPGPHCRSLIEGEGEVGEERERERGVRLKGPFTRPLVRASRPEIDSSPESLAQRCPQAGKISSKPHLVAYS